MGMHYRSESSSSLTNEQIDSNFRHLTGSKSITGSYTISGSLLPVNSSDSLGSNEQPWKEAYLSPDSVVFVSGGVSHSTSFPLETYVYDPQYGTYYPDDAGVNLEIDWDAYRTVPTENFPELQGFNIYTPEVIITPPSGSPGGSTYPNGANGLGGWWTYQGVSTYDNGGGFGVSFGRVLLGSEWLDRSRHYGTDGYNNSGSAVSGSKGHWQDKHSPRSAIVGKSSVMFDNTYPRLWQFSADAGWWGFGRSTYAQTNGQAQAGGIGGTTFGTEKNKVYYYNLLVSGSAYEIDPVTGEQVLNDLEIPPYDDGDIIVRMWNDNLPYWSYWSKLEYGEENVIHYNVSESNDPLGGPFPIFHQSSSNPGRIKLINNYKSFDTTNKKWNRFGWSKIYEYAYDYNPVDPFISSSNLMLSLKMMAGPYIHNPLKANYWNYPPSHVLNSGFQLSKTKWGPTANHVQGSSRIHLYNKKQYGSAIPGSSDGRYYINTSSLAPATNERAGLDGVYPTGAWSSQMKWNELDELPGSGYSLAYGYNRLFTAHPFGDCGINAGQGQTWAQIHPIIPLTTAHYPLSASHFWITSSYSNGTFAFRKPNDRVGSPSLFTLPFIATASLSPYTIYNANSTISSNRTIDLNGFDLTFSASNGETFNINASSSSEISITGLSLSNAQTLLGYNTSDGTLSIVSTTSMSKAVQPYYYSTGSTNDNAEVTNDIKLELGLVYDYDNGITLDNSIYEVNTAGKYYINVNGTLGEDSEPSSNGLGWWKVALQVNGTTVAESTAKQSEVGEHYGGLDLMYVGDFSVSDTIQLLSDTSPSSATSSISNTTYRFSAEYLGA